MKRRAQKSSAIPRHREIIEFLVQKICKDLDIPKP
jgi:mRNA interferase HicA